MKKSNQRFCNNSRRGNVKRIVTNYIKGYYGSDIRAYASDFSKEHITVDLYEMATGKKLEGEK